MSRTHAEHIDALRRVANEQATMHAELVRRGVPDVYLGEWLADEQSLRYAAGWLERYGPDDEPEIDVERAIDDVSGVHDVSRGARDDW